MFIYSCHIFYVFNVFFNFLSFYRASAKFVCLSECLSVKRVHCDKTRPRQDRSKARP